VQDVSEKNTANASTTPIGNHNVQSRRNSNCERIDDQSVPANVLTLGGLVGVSVLAGSISATRRMCGLPSS
jgi:hypothetical protein